MSIFVRWVAAALAVAALACSGVPAPAAVSADVAAAARREGTVMLYTTLDDKTLGAIEARFKQLYPEITLQHLVLSTQVAGPRLVAEQRGRNVVADLVTGDGFQLSQLIAADVLQPYRPSEAAKFIKGAVEPNNYWTSLYQDSLAIAWNPARLKADNLKPPTTLAELTRPQWKGHVGITSASFSWLAGLQQTHSDAADVLRAIAGNSAFVSANHFTIMTQLETGEFDATPTAYGHLAELDRQAGKPVEYITMRPQLLSPIPIALVKNAPHPNAARALLEFLLSREGQQLIVQQSGRSSARVDVTNNPHLFNSREPYFVIPAPDQAQYNSIVTLFNQTFGINKP
jgi:ABC-type Fe3+ transport system substrate-binding protein